MRESNTVSREFDSYMTLNMKSVSSFNEIQKNSKTSKSVSSSNETQKNSRSSKLISSLNKDQKQSVFSEQNNKNLIYHVNKSTEEKRLCISSECVSNILIIVHEREEEHLDFEITFKLISRSWYIRDLNKTLRFYIRNCFQCL